MIQKKLLLLLALILISGLSAVYGSTVVVPGADAATEPGSNNGLPFNIAIIGVSSERYEQVYASNAFSGGPILITAMVFRPDAGGSGAAFSTTLSNIEIDLSTTSANPNALSTTFANNIGADDTVVFGAGALALSSAFTGPAGGPKNFDIVINFTTPFSYDPSKGNLLLDVRNFAGGSTTQFDADGNSSQTSRLFTSSSQDVNSATGNTDNVGLVTEFVFGPTTSPVPEPAVPLVCGAGLFALAFARRFACKQGRPAAPGGSGSSCP